MACRNGHYDVAEYLIEKCGADVEQPGSGQIAVLSIDRLSDLFGRKQIKNSFQIRNVLAKIQSFFSCSFFIFYFDSDSEFFSWYIGGN